MHTKNWFLYSLLSLLFFQTYTSSSINDTISLTRSIKDGEVLVSSGGTFALGFFSPGNSRERYVGIWHNEVSELTIVWVANRAEGINGTFGVLSINQDGNLVIYSNDTRDVLLWSTNVSSAISSTSYLAAKLLDSGNLVLFQGDDKRIAWQSFDHPTNTFIPSMKLGLDRRTGMNWFLTSWKSRDDPGIGEYSYQMDPNGSPEMLLYKGLEPLWRTGPWVGNGWNGAPEPTGPEMANQLVKASFVDNEDEVYVAFGLTDASIFFRIVLNESGVLGQFAWQQEDKRWIPLWAGATDQCDYYGVCGANGKCDPSPVTGSFPCTCLPGFEPKSASEWNLRDWSSGCVRQHVELSTCRNGEGFMRVEHAKVPDTSRARVEKNLSAKDCEEVCLKNCSCKAYTSWDDSKCMTWDGDLMDTRLYANGGLDLYIRVDAIELAQYSEKHKSFRRKKLAIVVTSVTMVSLLFVSLAWWLVMKTRRTGARLDILTRTEEHLELFIFDIVTIVKATDNFADSNKIGEGGFGQVYKGYLLTGEEIAVKRLSENSKQGIVEFKNEAILIAKLQHRNLVKLLGCCIYGEERMLVYEFMPNGSLDSFIFDNTRSSSMLWSKRFNIILGIARGLLYLHQDSRLRVIHRDLKASNVLLDTEMNPKISDFGLARAFGGDQLSAETKRVVGTYGYMPPEYAIDGVFSMKSDIFSFGVIILEIVSGKRNRLFQHPDHDLNLLGHAWKLWTEGRAIDLVDPSMEGSFPMSEVSRCIQVGLMCVQNCPKDRPKMSSVLLLLDSEDALLPQPKLPGFYTERDPSYTKHHLTESLCSANEMTMTVLEAR